MPSGVLFLVQIPLRAKLPSEGMSFNVPDGMVNMSRWAYLDLTAEFRSRPTDTCAQPAQAALQSVNTTLAGWVERPIAETVLDRFTERSGPAFREMRGFVQCRVQPKVRRFDTWRADSTLRLSRRVCCPSSAKSKSNALWTRPVQPLTSSPIRSGSVSQAWKSL